MKCVPAVFGIAVAVLLAIFPSGFTAPQQGGQVRIVGGNTLEIDATPGSSYQLQRATSVAQPIAWQDVGSPTNVVTAGPVRWDFSTADALGFFRIQISASNPPISEIEARVIAEVIRPEEQTNLVLGLRWPTELAAGARIRPLSTPEESPEEWLVTAPSELLVIDHAPAHKLAHPFTYVIVAIESGQMQLIDAFYPPVVDGASHLTTIGDRWKAEARFFPTNFTDVPPLGLAYAYDIPDSVPTNAVLSGSAALKAFSADGTNVALNLIDCTTNVNRKKVAVVIASGADDEIQNDAREMSALLTRLGFTVTDFNSSSNSSTEVYNGIRQAGQGLGPCDKFFVYLSSHTQLVDDNDDGKPDGYPIRLDYGLGHDTKSHWAWLPNRGGTFAHALQGIPAGQMNVMLDTCFAASFGALLRKFNAQLPVGATWRLFASSATNKTSLGATTLDALLDYGNDEIHSVYTKKILDKVTAAADANQIDANGDGQLSIEEIEVAFTNAHMAAANELANGQQPKFDQLMGPLPTAVPDTFVTPPGQPITNRVALNDIVPEGTQFVLVQPPNLHTDLYVWNPMTGEMTLTGLMTINGTSFTYKLVHGTFETAPVTVTVQFNPRMNYAIEFLTSPDDTNKVRVPCIVLDGLSYPIYQLRLANNPADVCKEPHWHSHAAIFPVDVPNAPGRTDPDPSSCGFGKIKERPVQLLDVDKDVWEDFLIDHIPPL